ncbi:EbsA family protein [Fructobacillus sp. W13]|uniref:EbsA family protein n=1 Tax=Fructobacillus apis TaxID=2935017 RepID=A0ABT0ZNS1_9LACO|nr:EbsA family protein [Fructobacillus apis]MCO0831602.1 EbsA family protein [Fructobacillus apis]
MAKVSGFYQPAGDWNKTSWLLWASFLFVSPIWASELLYAVNLYWVLYTAFIVLIGCGLFFGRYFVIEDGQILIHSFLTKKTVSFSGVQVKGRHLLINNTYDLLISKKNKGLVKDILHG